MTLFDDNIDTLIRDAILNLGLESHDATHYIACLRKEGIVTKSHLFIKVDRLSKHIPRTLAKEILKMWMSEVAQRMNRGEDLTTIAGNSCSFVVNKKKRKLKQVKLCPRPTRYKRRRYMVTRLMKQSWPPFQSIDEEEAINITIPEEIFWCHIRPFIPIKDRLVISRRCSTRFPPPDRRPIEEAIKEALHNNLHYMIPSKDKPNGKAKFQKCQGDDTDSKHDDDSGKVKVWYKLPKFEVAVRVASSSDPDIIFKKLSMDTYVVKEAEGSANAVKRCFHSTLRYWDGMLSNKRGPTHRLIFCLKAFMASGFKPLPRWLAPGNGSIQDVIRYHVQADSDVLDNYSDDRRKPPLWICVVALVGIYAQAIETIYRDVIKKYGLPLEGTCTKFETLLDYLLEAGSDASIYAGPVLRRTKSGQLRKFEVKWGLHHIKNVAEMYVRNKDEDVHCLWHQGNDYDKDLKENRSKLLHRLYNKLASRIDPVLLKTQSLEIQLPPLYEDWVKVVQSREDI